MRLVRLQWGLALCVALGLLSFGQAHAQPSGISQKVAVCDPKFPNNCSQGGPFVPDAISTATLAVDATGESVALPGNGQTVIVNNTGSSDAYVKLGSASVSASTSDLFLKAGSSIALLRQTSTYIGGITGSGSTVLVISTGNGGGGGTGGGGGGGGGTVTVTNPFNLEATQLGVKADLDALAAALPSAIPAGANLIGHTDGAGAAAASLVGNPNRAGCRAATADPTAVTDAQMVDRMCGATGKTITLPYAIKELAKRGSTGATATATQVSIIASAGGSLKNYITAIQCSNSGATTSILTFTDDAATILINPAGGGGSWTFPVPLSTAAATAFQVTFGSASTSQYCSAQGYTGL